MKEKEKIENITFLFIVPTLNSCNELPKLIASIMEQDYKDWKIIFVDGKSLEIHKTWLKQYCNKDQRLINIDQEENAQGIYNAMNLGLKFAKKNYWTFFIGSDDWLYSSNSLKEIAKNIKINQKNNLSLVITNGNIINIKSQKIIRRNKVPSYNLINRKIFSKLLFRGYVPAHQTVCFSSNILKNIEEYSEDFLLASDLDMFLRLSFSKSLGNILFINKTCFNIGAGGISSRKTFRRFKEVIKIYLDYYKLKFIVPLFLRYLKKLLSRFINSI